MKHSHVRRWAAAYLLLALFLGSWAGQFVAMSYDLANEAVLHGEAFRWAEFWPAFLSSTFENWQSEWLQLLVQGVVLLGMKHTLFAVDAEDMEVVHHDLRAIKRALGLPDDYRELHTDHDPLDVPAPAARCAPDSPAGAH